MKIRSGILLAVAAIVAGGAVLRSTAQEGPPRPMNQTQAQADAKSTGCLKCHAGIEPMHASPAVRLGCVDCHGGNADAETKSAAHVAPRNPEVWKTSANPLRSYTALLNEPAEFVRFVNPGDLRVAPETCGSCHAQQVNAVPRSTMTTSAIFWAAVGYANGILGLKSGIVGEAYDREGRAAKITPAGEPSPQQKKNGALPFLLPLPRWETMQPGEYFRAFERGGIAQGTMPPEIGNPSREDEAGKPDIRLSNRGRGTGLRITPGLINLHKTRLNDPHLSFLGTNDHPGDYRSSGCTGCHVVYANDRDPLHSGPWAAFGNSGRTATADKSIPRSEQGHPVRHQLTRAVPTSQCMSCHMHQPNAFINTYLGYTMWDYESDARLLFPEKQRYPTEAEKRAALESNPEGAVVRGLWGDPAFLENVTSLNPKAKHTQFADYHGHGWNFMAVYKRDRKGNLLDAEGRKVDPGDPKKFEKAVHLRDIHLERGMHCSDCHFSRDEHGDGQLYSEYGSTIEIECRDCHGSVDAYTNLKTSGPAAPPGGTDLRLGTTPFGQRRFAWVDGRLYQRSMVNRGMQWEVVQVKDTVTPGSARYNERARWAKTVQRDGTSWGDPAAAAKLAHREESMTCYSCHSSWMTSCSGCHLPQEANAKTDMQHYEGTTTRNYASYNPQVIRTDAFMIGVNGSNKGNKIAPVRSSSALVISSTNAQRQRIYIQQPPISAPGYSSQAFNPHVPHTVRTRETQGCASCHLTKENDNNAWMAQLLLQGTNMVNFVGRFAWVGTGEHGMEGIAVTEWDEPQTVIGSSLHEIVYPDYHARHVKKGRELQTSYHHHGEVTSIQLRGEYLFTAGEHGFVVYDVANIDNKDFSERFPTAPFSPIGQRTYLKTKHAMAVALPTTMPVAPNRKTQFIRENQEQPIHPLYRYAYIADKEEGLVMVDVSTLTDGDPSNNFFKRDVTFNPGDALHGARSIAVAGRWVYIGCDRGLAVVDVDDPKHPRLVTTVEGLKGVTGIGVQFRYAFVTDAAGLHSVDVTDPRRPRVVASVPIQDARSVYVARTYAYVAGGHQGMVIVDVERPEKPFVDQVFNGGGALHDTTDIKVAATNASIFAYVADGEGGLKVVQLTSPEWMPEYAGFSPRPAPRIIATKKTGGHALAVSKGLDRDRAVDESGYQVSIFNRIGARPMTLTEMQRLYLRGDRIYTVSESPATPPVR